MGYYRCASYDQVQWILNATTTSPLTISGVTLQGVSADAVGYLRRDPTTGKNSTYWVGTIRGSVYSASLGISTTAVANFDSVGGFSQMYPNLRFCVIFY